MPLRYCHTSMHYMHLRYGHTFMHYMPLRYDRQYTAALIHLVLCYIARFFEWPFHEHVRAFLVGYPGYYYITWTFPQQ
jgi:hypothetical protein